jgi:anti-sigma B factor antagonist
LVQDLELCEKAVDERTHLVALRGEIDALTAPKLGRRLIRVTDEGKTGVVVDLTRVTFIDSTGISVLLNGLRQLTTRDGRLALVCPTARILRPFEIAGLTQRLSIFKTREEALGAVRAV